MHLLAPHRPSVVSSAAEETLKHRKSARGPTSRDPRASPSTSPPSSFWSSRDSIATVQQLLLFISKVRKRKRRRRGEEEETGSSSSILAHWSLWIIEKWRPKRGSNIHKDFLKRKTESGVVQRFPAVIHLPGALSLTRPEDQRCCRETILHLACVCECV